MNLNLRAAALNTYDAIVIGSGISGGWAAKELCEKGLKTIVLERGRNVEHIKDYPTALKSPWEFNHGFENTLGQIHDDPVQSQIYDESSRHFFVRDKEHPYIQETPFLWMRGYQVGGRSLTWGRQCYRWSDLDFEANLKDGAGVDWPIRYKDLAPWYSYVEQFVGISGQAEGLHQLPDGHFLPPIEMNCLEKHFREEVKKRFDGRCVTMGRVANLTRAMEGRGPCHFLNQCKRGCVFGGYFSSNSATLPAAMATGNLTIRPFSIVSEILYDKESKRAKGVRVIDTETKEVTEYFAKVIFLNASTIASASILLRSKSAAFPDGLGNNNDIVGRNLMDHHFKVGAMADHAGFKDQYYSGRRPVGFYIPRYRNIDAASQRSDYTRGFGLQGHAYREGWENAGKNTDGFGKGFKSALTAPGKWAMWVGGWGETLPYADNRVTLSSNQTDHWGLPLTSIKFSIKDNEQAMRKDIRDSSVEMLEQAGFYNIRGFNYPYRGGDCVHEMGTARMGLDPKTSTLNAHNQLHDVPNLFITDGSCMTSSACQNPSLTYMALTARACDYAVSELKSGRL